MMHVTDCNIHYTMEMEFTVSYYFYFDLLNNDHILFETQNTCYGKIVPCIVFGFPISIGLRVSA